MNKNTSIVSQHPIVRGLKEECKYRSNQKKKKQKNQQQQQTKHTHTHSVYTYFTLVLYSLWLICGHFFINAVVLVKIV